jgi:hypothetical protein
MTMAGDSVHEILLAVAATLVRGRGGSMLSIRSAALTLAALAFATGCCGSLKSAISDHMVSIHKTTEPTKELIEACKAGTAAACDAAKANVEAIEQSAIALETKAK